MFFSSIVTARRARLSRLAVDRLELRPLLERFECVVTGTERHAAGRLFSVTAWRKDA
jgi:hypothetical protein